MARPRRVVLTGGAGFIGSHVLAALLLRGDDVVILDDLNDFYDPAEKRDNLKVADPRGRAVLVVGDVRDERVWKDLSAHGRVDALIHLAGRAGVRPSFRDPQLYQTVNVGGSRQALAWAELSGRLPTLIASSSSIYGDRNDVPFREDAQPAPISPYGESKVAAEQWLEAARADGLPAVALRFFTVYGPRQRPDLAIRAFTERILRGEPIALFGDGSSARDHTHIDDIVRGVLSALDHLWAGDALEAAYNLGSDRVVTLSDLVARIERAVGRRATVERLADQLGDVRRTWADLTLSKRDLGYAPEVDLDQGLSGVVHWLHGRNR